MIPISIKFSTFIINDSSPEAIRQWLCFNSNTYTFPESLKIHGSKKDLPSGRWNTGIQSILGFGQDLLNLVQTHTAYLAWKVDLIDIAEGLPPIPFYEMSPEFYKLLTYTDLYFLGDENSNTPTKTYQALRDQNCRNQ